MKLELNTVYKGIARGSKKEFRVMPIAYNPEGRTYMCRYSYNYKSGIKWYPSRWHVREDEIELFKISELSKLEKALA
jgi:hypothetical protein